MPLFLTILEGPSPSSAAPLLATSDPDLIALVARELVARLGGHPQGRGVLRRLPPRKAGPTEPSGNREPQ